jgi:hypothetical protein
LKIAGADIVVLSKGCAASDLFSPVGEAVNGAATADPIKARLRSSFIGKVLSRKAPVRSGNESECPEEQHDNRMLDAWSLDRLAEA